MNNWNDDNDQDDNNSGGDLRVLLEKALKDNKALKTQVATAEQKLAVTTVSASLKDKGYKESAAKFAALDGVNLGDEKALNEWLEKDGADFKLSESEQPPEGGGEEQQQENPVIDEGIIQFANNADQLRSSASPAEQNKYLAALKSLPEDATPEQVDAAFKGL